jgi:two-component system sensor histidine kinase MprB
MPGSGLGLAIVRNAAVAHGGSVTATRASGGGTVVRMQLPVQPTPPDEIDDEPVVIEMVPSTPPA